jgi:hypothetical protein
MCSRRLAAPVAVMVLFGILSGTGCRSNKEADPVTSNSPRLPIADVLKRHSAELMAIDGVVGTYEGRTEDGEPCIKIMVVQDTPGLRDRLPRDLEGYPVVLRPTGEIQPRDDK